jgi:hypothetical protein
VKKAILNRGLILPILVLQFIPLVIFPLETFSLSTQEWWLPVLLAALSLLGTIELTIRKNPEPWPWYLISFAQGFNVISRLLMIMPHITTTVNDVEVFNTGYVVIATISILISWFLLWYFEQPEVHMGLLGETK